jgi:GT2 family glycosyltransferase
MLIRRTALDTVGLLDEGFFLYWDETEFCLRLRQNGWMLAAAPESKVLHKVNASTGGNMIVIDRYFTASGLRILRLYSQFPHLSMLLFLLIRFVRRIARLQFERCKSVWAGIQDYQRMLPIRQRTR